MLKGFSVRCLRDRRMIRFGRRWNTTYVASEVPAAHHGHTEAVRNLAGLPEVDVNHADENGMTALQWEAKKTYRDVVQALVDAGADIEAKNDMGRSPLLVACENGNISKVKMLVKAGAEVSTTDNQGNTCLILAARFGHTETVRYLVGLKDVDVNNTDKEDYTSLCRAV